MTFPQRIRLSRAKGWRMPENTISVARPTKFGNPFKVGEHGTRADCVRLHMLTLDSLFSITKAPGIVELRAYRDLICEALPDIKGKNLACWCSLPKLGQPDICHAYTLLVLANDGPGFSRLNLLIEAVMPVPFR